jgi:hypothetical protein
MGVGFAPRKRTHSSQPVADGALIIFPMIGRTLHVSMVLYFPNDLPAFVETTLFFDG